MTAKREIDKIFFRLDWWQYLRWKSPELIAEVMTRFMNHCSGVETIDIDANTKPSNEAETYLFPMVLQFDRDRSSYDDKCQANSANAKKRWRKGEAAQEEPQEETQEEIQEEPQGNGTYDTENEARNATDEVRNATGEVRNATGEGRNATEGKERNRKERNCFVFSPAQACEGDQNKTKQNNLTKEDIIFLSALYYLENGHTRPMAEAMSAYDFNEQSNWTEHKANGRDIDRSGDKLTWMRGWRCNKGGTISPAQGKCFADAARILDWRDPAVLDHYAGMTEGESVVTFLFDTKDAVKTFLSTLNSDQSKVDAFYDSLEANGVTLAGKTVRVEYRR